MGHSGHLDVVALLALFDVEVTVGVVRPHRHLLYRGADAHGLKVAPEAQDHVSYAQVTHELGLVIVQQGVQFLHFSRTTWVSR